MDRRAAIRLIRPGIVDPLVVTCAAFHREGNGTSKLKKPDGAYLVCTQRMTSNGPIKAAGNKLMNFMNAIENEQLCSQCAQAFTHGRSRLGSVLGLIKGIIKTEAWSELFC